MTRYALRRLASLVASLAVSSLAIFLAIEVAPGDPARFMLGINAQPDTVAALRAELGLDRPKPVRYLAWVGGMLTGDFGVSYTYRVPISEIVADRLAVSLPLALYALALSTIIAFPAGLYAAARRGRPGDVATMGAAQIGISVPNFWFAMMLVLVFAIDFGWFPAGGFAGWEEGILPALESLTLPAISLALPQAAILSRILRSSLLDVLEEDFVRAARAKGLDRRQTLWRHALRNALIPAIAILGLQFGFLIAGAIVIEQVFYLPGLGRLIFQAISQRDLILVESVVMLLVFAVIVVNFLADLAYAAVDPRLRRPG